MPELPDLHEALGDVEARWSPDRTESALAGLHKKRRRRAVTRSVGAGAAVAALTIGIYTMARRTSDVATENTVATTPPHASIAHRLADGTVLTRRSANSSFNVLEDTTARSVVRLTGGAITFDRDAIPAAKRSALTVTSHQVTVRVFAPSLWASHTQTATEVAPRRGHVDVDSGGKTHRVAAGERATFRHEPTGPHTPGTASSAPPSSPPATDTPPGSTHAPGAQSHTTGSANSDPGKTSAPAKAKRTWKKLATSGNYDKAYRALVSRGLDSVRDRVDDLMLAADVARISRHPRDAVRPLSRVMTRFSSDPRASLAAFTLGRILLDDLKRPLAAARAFRKAQILGKGGPLVEDALAREVEAWAAANKKDLAKLRGREYLSRYPRGHRVRTVKQYADL